MGEEHRLHIRRNALPGAAAARHKTADETAALDILHVRGGEVLHTLAEHAALRQHPEGDRARELHFPQRVQPGDVRRRVGLGIAERLRFPERVAVGKTAALHGVEHVVRCAVQNAGNGLNVVGLRREREIVEKRHAAAARRAEEKRRALFPRERRKLQTVRRDHRLVRGDEVLPGLKRAHTIGICRVEPAKRFHYGVDRRIAENERGVAHHEALDRLSGAHEHRTCLHAGGVRQHRINARADRTVSQNRNFHGIAFFL